MPQYLTILNHLKTKPITKIQALKLYGIWNSGNEIMKLRSKGHNITTLMIPREHGSAYAQYSLEV